MCTLWSINTNNTQKEKEEFQSVSLIVRKLENDIEYPSNSKEDFVHDLSEGFIKYVLAKTKEIKQPYYSCDITGCENHKSKELLKSLGLNYFISIPIPNQQGNKIIAFLKLAFIKNPEITQQIELLLAETIRDVVSSCFYRYMLYKKQHVMEELVENYETKTNKKLISYIFKPVINRILRNYCNYEGASFFMWDSYLNLYKLMATTGIKYIQESEYHRVVYKKGEGFTGKVANRKASIIYDDLEKEKDNPDYMRKFRETGRLGKTMMIIPIFNPSNKAEVIGILRFANKKNQANKNVIDYFNDADKALMEYVANYLALIIDYFLGDEERSIFIAKLSHEFSSPANAIRSASDRILKNIDNDNFMKNDLENYLESIKSFSDKQLQQTTAISYIFKVLRNIPKSEKYNIDNILLKDIIIQSKEKVKPIIKIYDTGISLDNIVIDSNFPLWEIKVDKSAFEIAFDNLFANAVKYQNNNTDFRLYIKGYEQEEYLVIEVSDNGLGIDKKDKEKIFHFGFRGENATRFNNNGIGVGLYVVKQIISDFGGEISVSNFSSPTTFEIKLPKSLLKK